MIFANRFEISKRTLLASLALSIGGVSVTGCGVGGYAKDAINPATSVSHDVESDSSLAREISKNFPGASGITSTNAENNPNIVTWNMPDGERCDAVGSATANRYKTPAHLVSVPYCRVVPVG